MKRLTASLMTLFFSIQAFAQSNHELKCGVSSKQNFSKELVRKKSGGKQKYEIDLNPDGSIPVIAYYSANPANSLGPVAITPAQIETQLEMVSAEFGSPFHFVVEQTIAVNDPELDHVSVNNKDESQKIFSKFTQHGKIHIFFSYQSDVCGWATAPHVATEQGIVISSHCLDSNRLNPNTLIHEMGHYFNLPHTFQHYDDENFAEKVARDGTCAWSGDGFCDTEADFLNSSRYTYYIGPGEIGYYGCTFDPYSPNPNYDLPVPIDAEGNIFHPNTDNHMSYFWDFCHETFTPEQRAMTIKTLQFRANTHIIPEIGMQVFPNPAKKSDIVKITFDTRGNWNDDSNYSAQIYVFDSLGRDVTAQIVALKPNSSIPFSDMAGIDMKFEAAGNYVIMVQLGDVTTQEILKKLSKKIIVLP